MNQRRRIYSSMMYAKWFRELMRKST